MQTVVNNTNIHKFNLSSSDTAVAVMVITLYIPVVAIGILANILVIVFFVLYRDTRTISNVFVLMISLADIAVVVIAGMSTVHEHYLALNGASSLVWEDWWCLVQSNITAICITASYWTLLLSSIHRYLRITHSNDWYLRVFGTWKVGVWCAVPWLSAFLVNVDISRDYVQTSLMCLPANSQQAINFLLFFVTYVLLSVICWVTYRRLQGIKKRAFIYTSSKTRQFLFQKTKLLRVSLLFSYIIIHLYMPYLLLASVTRNQPHLSVSSSLAVGFSLSKLLLLLCCSSKSLVYSTLNHIFYMHLQVLLLRGERRKEIKIKKSSVVSQVGMSCLESISITFNDSKQKKRKTTCSDTEKFNTKRDSLLGLSELQTVMTGDSIFKLKNVKMPIQQLQESLSIDSLVKNVKATEDYFNFKLSSLLETDKLQFSIDGLNRDSKNALMLDPQYFESVSITPDTCSDVVRPEIVLPAKEATMSAFDILKPDRSFRQAESYSSVWLSDSDYHDSIPEKTNGDSAESQLNKSSFINILPRNSVLETEQSQTLKEVLFSELENMLEGVMPCAMSSLPCTSSGQVEQQSV